MFRSFSQGLILLTVILMDLLAGMEFDLFVPSFPELQEQLNLTPSYVELLLSSNFLGYCLSLLFAGSLADHYGRKPVLLWGLSLFILGSIFCLLDTSFAWLLVGRFLQGVGIAAPSILSFLIVADTYPIEKQQYLLAILNGVMNISVAAAPILGSYLTFYFHWQGNFVALLMIGILVLMMTIVFIPNYKLPQQKDSLSLRGYLPIFQSMPLVILITHIVLMCVPYWIFVGISPLLYMEVLGVNLTQFGYYQGSLAFAFSIGCFIFGAIFHRYQTKKMLILSAQIFFIGLLSILFVSIFNILNPLLITLAFLPFVLGQIIPSTLLYSLALNFMPQAKGRVSAVMQSTRLALTALSLQLAAFYYHDSFQSTGLIMSFFIILSIISLVAVIQKLDLIQPQQHQ